MSDENEKNYKEIELKYKKMDAISRILAAIATSASAVAAFLALQNYTARPPQSVVPSAPTASTVPDAAPADRLDIPLF